MDYSRLSRETLIHEIEQLNEKVERLQILSKFDDDTSDEVFQLLDSLPEVVFYMDKSMIIKWGNRAAKEYNSQLLGKKCHQFLFSNSGFCDNCPCIESMNDGKSHSKVFTIDDNTSIEVLIIPVFNKIGVVVGYLSISRDADVDFNETEALKLEIEELKGSLEKMTKQYNSKAKWLTNMSRIMTSNVKAIRGAVNIVKQSDLTDIEKQYLEVADNTISELSYMIDELSDYSRLEENSLRLRRKEFRISALINRLVNRFKLLASQKKLIVESSVDESIPSIIIGDEDKLFTVLSRIIENAIKYTEVGSVKIEVNEISQSNDYVDVKFVVSDTGIGIKGDDINQVFERYFVTEYAKEKYDSVGLGLNIVKDTLSLMDSKVDISSSLGRGTKVSFIVRFKKLRNSKNDYINEIDFNEIKVLIVDKNVSVDVANYLIAKGYNVQYEDSGKRAVSVFNRWNPDIIITEIMIDDLDGFSIYDEVEKMSIQQIPVVATSEQIIDAERDFLISYGFADYLPKPIEKEQLCQTIDDLIKSYRK